MDIKKFEHREELKPVFDILARADKMKTEQAKYLERNQAEIEKLVAERKALTQQIEEENRAFNYVEAADLTADRDRIDLKIRSIESQMKAAKSSPVITKEEYDSMCTIARKSFQDFIKAQSKEALDYIKPLYSLQEDNHEAIELVNNVLHIIQSGLYKEVPTNIWSEKRLYEDELQPSIAIDHILDENRINWLEQITGTPHRVKNEETFLHLN